MPEPTSSQDLTLTLYNGSSGSSNGSDPQWNQVQPVTQDTVQNRTLQLQWRELPLPNSVPIPVNNVSNVQYVNSGINNVNNQIQYNPSYMNMPYQRPPMANGYTPLNPTRGINGPVMNGPNIIRTPNGQSIGGSNWPSQSVHGRYVPQAPTWTGNKTSGGVKKQKRIRTAFTSQQMMELEQEYARTRYLDRARRIELADVLRLNERTIKIWFQNRRMKEKKDRAESLEDTEEVSTSESSSEIGNVQMPLLIHEQYPAMPNEMYNQAGTYVEQYPSTSTASVGTGIVPSMYPSQVPVLEQNVYTVPEYITENQYHQYKQVQLQVQHHPGQYVDKVMEVSPEPVLPTEVVPATNASSDVLDKSWDFSWIKDIDIDEN